MEWAFLKKFPWFGYGLGVVLLGNKVSCIFFKKNFLQFVADFNPNKLCFDFFFKFFCNLCQFIPPTNYILKFKLKINAM